MQRACRGIEKPEGGRRQCFTLPSLAFIWYHLSIFAKEIMTLKQDGSKQKTRLLYLMDILYSRSDELHPISMEEIISALAEHDIDVERKSIYRDMEALKAYGVDVIGVKEQRNYRYYIGSRRFELAELKLLVDSVQAAKFMTAKKSRDLIKKIEGLASRYEAKELHRQVYVADRIKTENESIFYNVDRIHQAIGMNRQISFQYYNWDRNKNKELRRSGGRYRLSPWALLWSNENYYLIAYDSAEEKIKHFRVDKMLHISIEEDLREGQREFNDFDMGAYSRSVFGMFGGNVRDVKLRCSNDMAGVMIDRFGKDIIMVPDGDKFFTTRVDVAVSGQFFGWIAGLMGKVKIVEPEDVVEQMRRILDEISGQYREKVNR